MKKLSNASAVAILFLILSFSTADSSIVGKWTIHTPDHSDVSVTFNNDSTYNAVNAAGEHAIAGKYFITKDTLSFSDENCGINVWGKYKLTFYGDDSLDLKVIYDSCEGRKEAVNGVTGKRWAGK